MQCLTIEDARSAQATVHICIGRAGASYSPPSIDDMPDVQLVRPTRALSDVVTGERPRLQVGRPRTRYRAGGALDRDAADGAVVRSSTLGMGYDAAWYWAVAR